VPAAAIVGDAGAKHHLPAGLCAAAPARAAL